MKRYETYKDSGVDWLGEIPEHWDLLSFRFCIDILTDYTSNGSFASLAKNVNYLEEGYSRLVRLTDLRVNLENDGIYVNEDAHNFLSKSELFGGEMLIANVGAYAGLVKIMPYLDGKFTLAPNMFLLRLNQNTDFFYYQLNAPFCAEQLKMMAISSAQPKLNKDNIRQLMVLKPSFEEQKSITVYLKNRTDKIDELIAKKEQLIQLLEEERIAIINQAVTKGLNPDAPMKDSGIDWLGEIPEHWELKKLKFIFINKNSVRIPLSSEDRGKMKNKTYDYYGASGIIDKVDDYLFDEEHILIGEDGANLVTRTKRLAFIASGKYWVNNHAHILKPIKGNIEYLCELLELIDYSIWISGSAQPKLTQESLLSINMFEPPVNEQNEIVAYLNIKTTKIDTTLNKIRSEIDLLKEYKTTLISDVVTGKIDVREEVLN